MSLQLLHSPDCPAQLAAPSRADASLEQPWSTTHLASPSPLPHSSPPLTGCLKSLLSEGAATLHCYRWQAALPGGAGGDAAADALAAADGADPELAELLGSLQQLALLVPEPLPGRLPTFTLAAPAPASPAAGPADGSSPGGEAAEEPGNSTVPHATAAGGGESASSGGGTISVRLVPAGTLHLPREQLQPALCCSSCLLAHMFARGGFCGAAGKLVAAEPDPEAAASPAVDGDAPSAPAGASPGGGSGGEGAPSTPAAARAPTSTALKGQVDEPAPMQVDGPTDSVSEAAIGAAPAPPAAAAAADSEDAEAAAAASALVRSVLHRVLLLHDKRGLPRPKRSRAEEQAAELAASAAAADEAGFLLLPLLGGAAGASADASTSSGAAASTVDGAVDWAAVQEIAAAASFEGTLLQWMQRSQADGVSQADGKGGEGACPPPRASAAARLGGRLVLTTYNGQAYLCRCAGARARLLLTCCAGCCLLRGPCLLATGRAVGAPAFTPHPCHPHPIPAGALPRACLLPPPSHEPSPTMQPAPPSASASASALKRPQAPRAAPAAAAKGRQPWRPSQMQARRRRRRWLQRRARRRRRQPLRRRLWSATNSECGSKWPRWLARRAACGAQAGPARATPIPCCGAGLTLPTPQLPTALSQVLPGTLGPAGPGGGAAAAAGGARVPPAAVAWAGPAAPPQALLRAAPGAGGCAALRCGGWGLGVGMSRLGGAGHARPLID